MVRWRRTSHRQATTKKTGRKTFRDRSVVSVRPSVCRADRGALNEQVDLWTRNNHQQAMAGEIAGEASEREGVEALGERLWRDRTLLSSLLWKQRGKRRSRESVGFRAEPDPNT
ncbi:hypothetical protein VTN49DRAFT_335 [Thermomyces lanuginosus]|uniref:uncharacterized protein n=1 Tax=Thermomyces lanuginosus TaxID=5541 RepID=UPI0037420E6D